MSMEGVYTRQRAYFARFRGRCSAEARPLARIHVDEVLQESMTLRADASSARAARRFLRSVLEGWQCDHVIEVTLLAANELVTNAILHARTELHLLVRLQRDSLRIEVADHDDQLPIHRHVPEDATEGRGIALIDAVAARWGVDALPDGKRVWFELPT
jgi:anti-sigma regulatory factor (Ser/Thr protein kinase)